MRVQNGDGAGRKPAETTCYESVGGFSARRRLCRGNVFRVRLQAGCAASCVIEVVKLHHRALAFVEVHRCREKRLGAGELDARGLGLGERVELFADLERPRGSAASFCEAHIDLAVESLAVWTRYADRAVGDVRISVSDRRHR